MINTRFNVEKNLVEVLKDGKYKKITDKEIMEICIEENISPNDFIEKVKAENSYSKEAEKKAEKERKEAEKKAEKERKEAEKKAEKERKEAEKQANIEEYKNKFQELIHSREFIENLYATYKTMKPGKFFNILCAQIAKGYTDIELGTNELKTIEFLLDIKKKEENEVKKSKEDEWKKQLDVRKDEYATTINNYKLWIANESKYANKVKYNEFFDYIEYNGDIIKDEEEGFIEEQAEMYFKHNINWRNIQTAFRNYAYDNKYNPVKEYLKSLEGKWDGTKRLETFIIKCLDADDNNLVRFFTKTWMIGAVKRVFEPTCQFDCVLALQGGIQGSGKTNLFKCLFGSDSPLNYNCYKIFASGEFTNKDAIDKMNKSWCVLLDEFDKFNDREVADLKSKITETTMTCRKAYGHNNQDYKVHWVYAATTNADDFLCDLTGDEFERRYWIIECHKNTVDGRVKEILTHDFVNQLWAEAMYYYINNEYDDLYLSSSNTLFEEYKKYQIKFKKTSKNAALVYLNEILNRQYTVDEEGCFKDSIDMFNQFTVHNIDMTARYINKVPCAYIRHILAKVYNLDYKPKFIQSLLKQLGNEWECKNARYLGKTVANVLVRVNPIANDVANLKEVNGLPF